MFAQKPFGSGFGTSAGSGVLAAPSGPFGTSGMFGTGSAFGQPANSTGGTTGGFGFGAAPNGGLFGNVPSGGGGLFSNAQQNTGGVFGQNKPNTFTGFGGNTGSLFGGTGTSGSLFGGGVATANAGSVFGAPFGAATPTGTTIKFTPVSGTDSMIKNGLNTQISTQHQCITAMKEYEAKSLEELRLEDYAANRKGPQAGCLFMSPANNATTTSGLFGTGNTGTNNNNIAGSTGLTFGQKAGFGTGFTTGGTGMFGQPQHQQQQAPSVFGPKPFGLVAPMNGGGITQGGTAPGFSFQASGFGPGATNTAGVFGNSVPVQQGCIFGAGSNTATAFGSNGGLFPSNNTLFNNSSSGLFHNKPTAGFSMPTANVPTFGPLGAGSFCAKPGGLTLGNTASGQLFGFPSNNGGSGILQNKPNAGVQPGTLAGMFGMNSGQNMLFGVPQPKLAGLFSSNPFSTSNPTLVLGNSSVPLDINAQQLQVQQQVQALALSPFGDSPLFSNPTSDLAKKQQLLKPTSTTTQKSLVTPSHYRLSPRATARVRPKALVPGGAPRATPGPPRTQMAPLHLQGLNGDDGQEEDEARAVQQTFTPRKSVKKLVIVAAKTPPPPSPSTPSSPLATSPTQRHQEADDLAPQSVYPEPAERPSQERHQEGDHHDEVDGKLGGGCDGGGTNFREARTGPQRSPPHSPGPTNGPAVCHSNGLSSPDGSVGEFSSKDAWGSEQESRERDTQKQPHPAGMVLTRAGYFTIPSLEELGRMVDEDGVCTVTNFVIGRVGYGSILFPGRMDVSGLDLDAIVHIRRKEVIVYPDDGSKPRVGQGLNRRAEVTLDGVWPTDKTSRTPIRSPERLQRMEYGARLEKAALRQGARFLEYRPESGSWVFEVNHFSAYGLAIEDEIEQQKEDERRLVVGVAEGLTRAWHAGQT
ncbi:nuclear pore complex protein Nup98-Nup96-like [Petromyzon marinus]|uniref:Nuclear pore complex protein Nup98-Nup96 n=1 Tax=Petromyzon marinus TaxID=7757 RepID=A0AAJ7T7E0_PETMA|nr:nuclear pore complex protein Nup98-Nup96-like [Petromyzon marinus]